MAQNDGVQTSGILQNFGPTGASQVDANGVQTSGVLANFGPGVQGMSLPGAPAPKNSLWQDARDVGQSVEQGLNSLGQSAEGLANAATGGWVDQTKNDFVQRAKTSPLANSVVQALQLDKTADQANTDLEASKSQQGQEGDEAIQNAHGLGGIASAMYQHPAEAIGQAANQAAAALPYLVQPEAGIGRLALTGAAQAGGAAFQQELEKDGGDVAKAYEAGGLSAAGGALGTLIGGKIAQPLAEKIAGAAPLVGDFIKRAVGSGANMSAYGVTQNQADVAGQNVAEGKPITEGLGENVGQTAASGFLGGVGFHAGASVVHALGGKAPSPNTGSAEGDAVDSDTTPPGRGNMVAGLNPQDFGTYRNEVVRTESAGGNYGAMNPKTGAVGAYQFMPDTLAGMGYVAHGTDLSNIHDPAQWLGHNGIHSLDQFMADQREQDNAFASYTDGNYRQLMAAVKNGTIPAPQSPGELAGYLKGMHLGGLGGLEAALRDGVGPNDGHTSVGQYIADGASAFAPRAETPPPSPQPAKPAQEEQASPLGDQGDAAVQAVRDQATTLTDVNSHPQMAELLSKVGDRQDVTSEELGGQPLPGVHQFDGQTFNSNADFQKYLQKTLQAEAEKSPVQHNVEIGVADAMREGGLTPTLKMLNEISAKIGVADAPDEATALAKTNMFIRQLEARGGRGNTAKLPNSDVIGILSAWRDKLLGAAHGNEQNPVSPGAEGGVGNPTVDAREARPSGESAALPEDASPAQAASSTGIDEGTAEPAVQGQQPSDVRAGSAEGEGEQPSSGDGQPAPAGGAGSGGQVRGVLSDDERLANKKAAYAAYKGDDSDPHADGVAANNVAKAQEQANTIGEPVVIWRSESGMIGRLPKSKGNPFKNGEKIAEIHPEVSESSPAIDVKSQETVNRVKGTLKARKEKGNDQTVRAPAGEIGADQLPRQGVGSAGDVPGRAGVGPDAVRSAAVDGQPPHVEGGAARNGGVRAEGAATGARPVSAPARSGGDEAGGPSGEVGPVRRTEPDGRERVQSEQEVTRETARSTLQDLVERAFPATEKGRRDAAIFHAIHVEDRPHGEVAAEHGLDRSSVTKIAGDANRARVLKRVEEEMERRGMTRTDLMQLMSDARDPEEVDHEEAAAQHAQAAGSEVAEELRGEDQSMSSIKSAGGSQSAWEDNDDPAAAWLKAQKSGNREAMAAAEKNAALAMRRAKAEQPKLSNTVAPEQENEGYVDEDEDSYRQSDDYAGDSYATKGTSLSIDRNPQLDHIEDQYDGVHTAEQQLRSRGLGHVVDAIHRWTEFVGDSKQKGWAWVEERNGKITAALNKALAVRNDPEHTAHSIRHELAHVLDNIWHGGVYSSQPELRFEVRNGEWSPVGEVAKEIYDVYNSDAKYESYFRYPLATQDNPSFLSDPARFHGEVFAQAQAAYTDDALRTVLERELPKLAQFLKEVEEHGQQSAEAVRDRQGAIAEHAKQQFALRDTGYFSSDDDGQGQGQPGVAGSRTEAQRTQGSEGASSPWANPFRGKRTYDTHGEPVDSTDSRFNTYGGILARGLSDDAVEQHDAAIARLRLGDDPEQVRQDTGWHRGLDGKMRMEFSDADAKLNKPLWDAAPFEPENEAVKMPLHMVLDHPTLFKNYPELSNIRVIKLDSSDDKLGGWYDASRNLIAITQHNSDPLNTLLHETQHAVQSIEHFQAGGMPGDVDLNNPKNASAVSAYLDRRPSQPMTVAGVHHTAYELLHGEAEARDTQRRQNLTGGQRKEIPPRTLEGLRPDEVTFASKSQALSVKPDTKPEELEAARADLAKGAPAVAEAQFRARGKYAEAAISALPEGMQDPARRVYDNLHHAFENGAYSLLFGHDVADIAKGKFGMLVPKKYMALMSQKQAYRNMLQEATDKIGREAMGLKPNEQRDAGALLQDATLKGKWPFNPEWRSDVKDEQIDPVLAARFNAMPDSTQSVIKSMLQHGDIQRQQLIMANANIARQYGIDPARIVLPTDGPYFPLARLGDFVVEAKSQQYADTEAKAKAGDTDAQDTLRAMRENNPSHYRFYMTKDFGAANALREQLIRRGEFKRENVSAMAGAVHYETQGGASFESMQKLRRLMEGQMGNKEYSDEVIKTLNELSGRAAADSTSRLVNIKRGGVAGLRPEDAFETFFAHGARHDSLVTNMMKAKEVGDALRDMQGEADSAESPELQKNRRDIANEFATRSILGMRNKEPSRIVDNLMAFNTTWRLFSSPAHYLQYVMQPLAMAMPRYARFGTAKAMAAAVQGMHDSVKLAKRNGFRSYNWQGHVGADDAATRREMSMLHTVKTMGMLDTSHGGDYGNPSAHSEGLGAKWVRAVDLMSGVARSLEGWNRIGSALAAYRTSFDDATGRGMGEAEAHNYATNFAHDTLRLAYGDYSAANAPSVLTRTGDFGKFVFQYKKFSMIHTSLMAHGFADAFKGEDKDTRAAGRKQLGVMAAMYAVAGGALGIPLSDLVAGAVNQVFGKDGDTDETTLRRIIGNNQVADMVLHGLPGAVGINATRQLGAGDVVTGLIPGAGAGQQLIKTNNQGAPDWGKTALGVLGPFLGSTAPQLGTAAWRMANGEFHQAIPALLPKGIQDAWSAYNMGVNGQTNSRGDVLTPAEQESALGLLAQGLGLKTTQGTTTQENATSLRNETEEFTARRAAISDRLANGDTDIQTARQEWNKVNADARAAGQTKLPSVSTLVKAKAEQAKRERMTRNGVQATKSNAGLLKGMETAEGQ